MHTLIGNDATTLTPSVRQQTISLVHRVGVSAAAILQA
jgi:hypothetical protein